MNMLKKHRLSALLLLAAIVLAGYLAFFIPSGYQLQLRDRKADELIAAWPIAPGDQALPGDRALLRAHPLV